MLMGPEQDVDTFYRLCKTHSNFQLAEIRLISEITEYGVVQSTHRQRRAVLHPLRCGDCRTLDFAFHDDQRTAVFGNDARFAHESGILALILISTSSCPEIIEV